MVFESNKTFRRYRQVADQIEAMILSGELAVMSCLPDESELARGLNVPQATIREAMIALEIGGFVEVRTGERICVRDRHSESLKRSTLLGDVGAGPLELLDARALLESAIAFEAAERATKDDLERIDAAITNMRTATDQADLRDYDRDFHTALANSCHNGVLLAMIDTMWKEMYSPLFDRLGHLTGLYPTVKEVTASEHQAILDGLLKKDGQVASDAMRFHLEKAKKTLLSNPLRKASYEQDSQKSAAETPIDLKNGIHG